MKSIVTTLNNLIPNQTVQSVLRYALTLLAAFLAGRGVADGIVAFVAGGAIITLLTGILGAANELYAPDGTWNQFWLSIVRKLLAFAGAFAIAAGWLAADATEQLLAVAVSLTGIIWGTTDEAAAQAAAVQKFEDASQ